MNRSSLAPFPAVLLFVWAALSHPPALAEFTVQQILSAPFPSSLTTSSTGSQVAWVFDDQGVDDVWIAEGPKFAAKQLTDFDRDDGRSLSIVGFTADGKFLVFARGNDYNPDHDPDGPTKGMLGRRRWRRFRPRRAEPGLRSASEAIMEVFPERDFCYQDAVATPCLRENDVTRMRISAEGTDGFRRCLFAVGASTWRGIASRDCIE